MRRSQTNAHREPAPKPSPGGLLAGLCVFALVMFGVVQMSASRKPFAAETSVVPQELDVIVFDVSGSTIGIRRKLEGTGGDTAEMLPLGHELRLLKFGSRVVEFYSGTIDSSEDFRRILRENVSPTDPVGGTDYGAVIERIAQAAEETRATSVCVLIVGDGISDTSSPNAAKRYRTSAQRLVNNPKVREIRFWGVNADPDGDLRMDPRDDIRRMFAGSNQQKLRILNFDQSPW